MKIPVQFMKFWT